MPVALASVFDKTGIARLCAGLIERGWTIISTGGTRQFLLEAGLDAGSISDATGYPEILGGRVKTMHPVVHGGVLARRHEPNDMRQLADLAIEAIDLVAVNLYPFRETVAQDVPMAEALEQIDIGGPALLRAAAKNYPFVWPVCDPADYDLVLAALDGNRQRANQGAEQSANQGEEQSEEQNAEQGEEVRRELAAKVYRHTAEYDLAIANHLSPTHSSHLSPDHSDRLSPAQPDRLSPDPSDHVSPARSAIELDRADAAQRPLAGSTPPTLSLELVQELRYGENPDQKAAFFRNTERPPWGIPALEQLHGKELSFNNILDLDGAITALAPFSTGDRAACAIIKHATVAGIAVGSSSIEAYEKAFGCDPVSAFGSVVNFTEPLSEDAARAIARTFVECIIAPDYDDDALSILREKKNIRILRPQSGNALERGGHLRDSVEFRGVRGGVLLQSAPSAAREAIRAVATVPTARAPRDEEWDDLAFAWSAVQSVKSNAILLARGGASIGIGAGQMSRVDSVRLAIEKARAQGHEVSGAALSSDAFFPFPDGVEAAAEAGVAAIVQPGGSKRDGEVVRAADEHGMAMVFTGRRLFRH